MTPYFSVIIPTYNRRQTLLRTLRALAAQTLPAAEFEVIVSIDGSTDGTQDALSTERFPFSFRELTQPNGGASKARNAGIAAAKGEFIAFTEDDVVPEPNWLESAKAQLLRDKVDVLDGTILDLDTRQNLRRLGIKGIPAFLPCNLFVRRNVFEKLGGYDENYYDPQRHLYFREDSDLGFRILDAGYSVALAPEVIIRHPPQFNALTDCLRHGRRYVFDALLFKKFPSRYRTMIEAKNIFGLKVCRPQYLLALAYVLFLALAIAAVGASSRRYVAWSLIAACACAGAYRFKYQGLRALQFYRVGETLGFFWAPLVYLGALIRGARRYHSWGVLRPW